MAFTSEIEAAARVDSRPTRPAASEINDGAVLSMPAGRRGAELEERRLATACVNRFARGDTDTLLETLGLIAPPPLPPKAPPPPATEKRCPRCEETKPVAAFDRNRAVRDGRATECKVCRSALDERKKTLPRVVPDAMRCNKCRLTKPAAEFARNSSSRTGLTSQCKECRNGAKRDRLVARKAGES